MTRGPGAVLSLLGNVGTATMQRSAPIALETGTLFFGAFTGATSILRNTLAGACARYVFNVRASYAQETRAALEFFFAVKVPDAAHVVSFDQNDTFGQAGYDGLVAGYTGIRGDFSPVPVDPTTPIPRFRYDKNDPASPSAQVVSVAAYLAQLLAADSQQHTVGIFLTSTYGPATTFITELRNWQYAQDPQQTTLSKATRLTLYFDTVSFVGPNALASHLRDAGSVTSLSGGPLPYTTNVFMSQVVPNYQSDASDITKDYIRLIGGVGSASSFTSFEGYVAARVFIAGLLAHEGPFTPDLLIPTFESLPNLSLGLGAQAGFSKTNHNYSNSVWGTSVAGDGSFSNVYYWSDGTPIQLFE
jgi:hypothetical protein